MTKPKSAATPQRKARDAFQFMELAKSARAATKNVAIETGETEKSKAAATESHYLGAGVSEPGRQQGKQTCRRLQRQR